MMRLCLIPAFAILLLALPAFAVTEKLFPVPAGAVIELCRPGEDETPCIESPNLRVRYSTLSRKQQVLAEMKTASKRLGWRMHRLPGVWNRYQSANPKRPWDIMWDLRPAPPDENGPAYHIYYWKIMGE